MLTRRSLFFGLIAAPAVVKAASLMPVKLWQPNPNWYEIMYAADGTFTRYAGYDILNLRPATYLAAPIFDFASPSNVLIR
jgi:hypothetical protein